MPRGGARENSGRKPKWNLGETKAIRVPVALADMLLEIAKRIDEGENLESILSSLSQGTTPKLSSTKQKKPKSQELGLGKESGSSDTH